MRRRAVRRRAVGEIVLLGEELDTRSLTVDVNPVTEVKAGPVLSGGGLSELTSDFREVDRQALDVDRGLLRRGGVCRAENQQPDQRGPLQIHGS